MITDYSVAYVLILTF